MPYDIYPYELPPLPYAYNALEPYIDEETMHYHHDKHFQTYINNLNNALKKYPYLQKIPLEQVLKRAHMLPFEDSVDILQSGGGVYNHKLFFEKLAPVHGESFPPSPSLLALINQTFGSFDKFKDVFSKHAMGVFGSGWTYLILTNSRRLKIVNLRNQDTPIKENGTPIILFDCWEHAYYLKYKNARKDYIDALWNIIKF